jgi:hypothetical protein
MKSLTQAWYLRSLAWPPNVVARSRTGNLCLRLEFGHFAYVKAIRGWGWSPTLRARTMHPVGVTP